MESAVLNESNDTTASFTQKIYGNVRDAQASMLSDMPFAGSPVPTLLLLIFYLMMVKIIGPVFMEYQKPYNPRRWIIAYNIFQILANSYMFYYATAEILQPKHSLTCLKIDRASAMLMYYFFLNKLSDLTETFFFLVKKSYRQISFLHLYHHVMVISAVWLDIFLQPGGQGTYVVFLNTFVHVFMYTYYLLTSWNKTLSFLPKLKQFVTQIQLTQFGIGLLIYMGTLLFGTCADRKHSLLLILGSTQYIYMMYMFGNFYQQNYLTTNKRN